MVQCLFELLGAREQTGVGNRFLKLVEAAGRRMIPGFEMPPLLCRELNRKPLPVLESLDISTADARFISEFT